MIPGLSMGAEAGLLRMLVPEITSATPEAYAAADYHLFTGRDAESEALGVRLTAGPDLLLAVTDPGRRVGELQVQTGGAGTLLFIDNRAWRGSLYGHIRVLGEDCALLFHDIGAGFVALGDVFLRGHRQFLFWGQGATAVGCSLEVEGEGQGVVIGDDALISNGVWIRNHGMHALHDLRTGARVDRPPVTTVLERHVWLGQDALLISCERIGMGTVVGARALVKGSLPPRVVAAGVPARVLRQGVSWGRSQEGMTQAERLDLGLPGTPHG